MRIATWNVNSIRVRLPQLLDWLAAARPDVVALQEIKCVAERFPHDELAAAGYAVAVSGQPAYNGVALLSRLGAPADLVTDLPGLDDPQRRVLAATIAGTRVVCLYCPNGQAVGSEKFAYKLAWFAALERFLAAELVAHPALVALGDFNIAPEDRDVHDPAAWSGKVLCSEPERAALGRLIALGLGDCFRRFPQRAASFSWWDYRGGGYAHNHGLRIDLVLASAPLAARCTLCAIDEAPRGLERPSDHAPVVADFGPEP
jgi:exodeoxyribonuclease-3